MAELNPPPVYVARSATARRVRARRPAAGRGVLVAVCGAILLAAGGCAVPQPRGNGELSRVIDPQSHRGYWQYFPVELVKHREDPAYQTRRYPVVVSFHGMKPFDNALKQALEWELEADRYSYIVVAPELSAPDVFQQFPVRTIHPAFRGDEVATISILDHVFATTPADRGNVLSTSWSSGGYIAHYMLNRHPDYFSCLGVRQSNFSESVLDGELARRSVQSPVLIVNSENDFKICKTESREAVNWYERNGYQNVAWVYVRHLGHERTPDLAADFFARVIGIEPNWPPDVLVSRQAIDGNPRGLALLAGNLSPAGRQPSGHTGLAAAGAPALAARTPRPTPIRTNGNPASAGMSGPRANGTVTAASNVPGPARAAQPDLGIYVSTGIGEAPLLVGFSPECPESWRRTADFLWSLNGNTICTGVNGQKTIAEPGEYWLSLLVVTEDGLEHRAAPKKIHVLRRDLTASAGQ